MDTCEPFIERATTELDYSDMIINGDLLRFKEEQEKQQDVNANKRWKNDKVLHGVFPCSLFFKKCKIYIHASSETRRSRILPGHIPRGALHYPKFGQRGSAVRKRIFVFGVATLLLTGCTEKTDESHGKPADIETENHSDVIIEKDGVNIFCRLC